MPAGWLHEYMEKKVLKYSNKTLHKLMDSTWKAKGINHREDFHDLESIILLSLIAGGDPVKNLAAGLLHIYADKYFSRLKSWLIKQGVDQKTADLVIYYVAKALISN